MSNASVQKPPSQFWLMALGAAMVLAAVLWSWSCFGIFEPTPFDGDQWNICGAVGQSRAACNAMPEWEQISPCWAYN
jgi:hypothetical protein